MSASGARAPLPGTRPEGARDDAEASRQVREMFSRIAPRYDLLNHLLSFSIDKRWRRRTAERFRHILRRPDSRVLDLCCGTGDLTLALDQVSVEGCPGPQAARRIVGSDFTLPMLELAMEKTRRARQRALFLDADSLALPFADGSFDLVTAAFGFRNLANYAHGLREFARVLRPHGELGILEFCEPRRGLVAPIYRFYFKNILPRIGGAISGSSAAYAYLPGSVTKFPQPEELAAWIERAGFTGVHFELWTFGIVALHTARRP